MYILFNLFYTWSCFGVSFNPLIRNSRNFIACLLIKKRELNIVVRNVVFSRIIFGRLAGKGNNFCYWGSMLVKERRNYSAVAGSSAASSGKNNVEKVCLNGKDYYILSPLNKLFEVNLTNILKKLKGSELYQLEYYVFLWTNDHNIGLLNIDERDILDTNDPNQWFAYDGVLEEGFDYKGFYLLLNDLSKGKDIINSEMYRNEVILGLNLGLEINRMKPTDKYVEYHTSILVYINSLGPYSLYDGDVINETKVLKIDNIYIHKNSACDADLIK